MEMTATTGSCVFGTGALGMIWVPGVYWGDVGTETANRAPEGLSLPGRAPARLTRPPGASLSEKPADEESSQEDSRRVVRRMGREQEERT